MNHRKKIFILLVSFLAITLLTLVYIFLKGDMVCDSYTCYDFLFNGKRVLFIFTPLFIVASLLFVIFFSERVLNVWKKFAIIATPLMIIGILLVKIDPMACGVLLCVDRIFAVFLFGIIYTIISIFVTIISAICFWIKRKKLK